MFFLLMIIVVVMVVGRVIMFLWNNILVEVTGVQPLGFWQAIGLFVLSRILFGSWHFGPKHRRSKASSRKRMKDKWMNMSEEERAEFQERWRERCRKRK